MPRRNRRPRRNVRSLRQVKAEMSQPVDVDTDHLARVLVGRGLADPSILGLNTSTSARYRRDPETGEV